MYYIYVIHNIINNKVYVGKTNDTTRRWYEHKKCINSNGCPEYYIHRAIKKYGIEAFTFIPFQLFDDEDKCYAAEIYWISYFNSNNKNSGYNLTIGGKGGRGRKVSEETRKKLSQINTGKKHSEETKEKLRKAGLGRVFPKEIKQKLQGSNNPRAKLSEKEVIEIREKYNTLQYSRSALAREYNVKCNTICRIIKNENWKCLGKFHSPPIEVSTVVNGKVYFRLTEKQKAQIKELYTTGLYSQKSLGMQFNVSYKTISKIVSQTRINVNE